MSWGRRADLQALAGFREPWAAGCVFEEAKRWTILNHARRLFFFLGLTDDVSSDFGSRVDLLIREPAVRTQDPLTKDIGAAIALCAANALGVPQQGSPGQLVPGAIQRLSAGDTLSASQCRELTRHLFEEYVAAKPELSEDEKQLVLEVIQVELGARLFSRGAQIEKIGVHLRERVKETARGRGLATRSFERAFLFGESFKRYRLIADEIEKELLESFRQAVLPEASQRPQHALLALWVSEALRGESLVGQAFIAVLNAQSVGWRDNKAKRKTRNLALRAALTQTEAAMKRLIDEYPEFRAGLLDVNLEYDLFVRSATERALEHEWEGAQRSLCAPVVLALGVDAIAQGRWPATKAAVASAGGLLATIAALWWLWLTLVALLTGLLALLCCGTTDVSPPGDTSVPEDLGGGSAASAGTSNGLDVRARRKQPMPDQIREDFLDRIGTVDIAGSQYSQHYAEDITPRTPNRTFGAP